MITEPWAGRIHPRRGAGVERIGRGGHRSGDRSHHGLGRHWPRRRQPQLGRDSDDAATGSGDGSGSDGSSGDGTGWGLDVPGVIRTTGRSGQTVALTFSSGPDPLYTPDILDILDAHGVKATFCILGTQAEEHPQLVEQIAAEGHVLCDHTMTYDYALAARDDATIQAEIEGGLSAIRAAVPGRLSAVLPSARRQFLCQAR